MRAGLVGDPGEHHRLARLELHTARERGQLADLDIVCAALAELERAVVSPDLASLLRQPAIGLNLLLGAPERQSRRHRPSQFLLTSDRSGVHAPTVNTARCYCGFSQTIIHGVPNLSVSIA